VNPAKVFSALRSLLDTVLNPPEVFTAVGQILDLVLDLVPHDVARQALDDAAVRRANTIADAAELAKFGPKDPP
jgi:hypothetical protein